MCVHFAFLYSGNCDIAYNQSHTCWKEPYQYQQMNNQSWYFLKKLRNVHDGVFGVLCHTLGFLILHSLKIQADGVPLRFKLQDLGWIHEIVNGWAIILLTLPNKRISYLLCLLPQFN